MALLKLPRDASLKPSCQILWDLPSVLVLAVCQIVMNNEEGSWLPTVSYLTSVGYLLEHRSTCVCLNEDSIEQSFNKTLLTVNCLFKVPRVYLLSISSHSLPSWKLVHIVFWMGVFMAVVEWTYNITLNDPDLIWKFNLKIKYRMKYLISMLRPL